MMATIEGVTVTAEPAQAVPKRWERFAKRLATLSPGRAYTIVLVIPAPGNGDPVWAITDSGKVENAR